MLGHANRPFLPSAKAALGESITCFGEIAPICGVSDEKVEDMLAIAFAQETFGLLGETVRILGAFSELEEYGKGQHGQEMATKVLADAMFMKVLAASMRPRLELLRVWKPASK